MSHGGWQIYHPWMGRFPDTTDQMSWAEIDFGVGEARWVIGAVTQGRNTFTDSYVTRYRLVAGSEAQDGTDSVVQTDLGEFDANMNGDTKVYNYLQGGAVQARTVQFIVLGQIQSSGWPSMRMDVLVVPSPEAYRGYSMSRVGESGRSYSSVYNGLTY